MVLHLAAQALVRPSYEDPVGTYETNVLGTARLLEALRAAAPEAAIVVVTSDKCYAGDGSGRAFREGDRLGGRDPYSSSKAAQELVAASFRESYGLRIATARAGNVIGGGDWAAGRLVPDFVRAAAGVAPLVVRNPGSVRPWQHVLNPLASYLMLAERLLGAGDWATAWNLGPAARDERSVADVLERLRAIWPGAPEALGSGAVDTCGPRAALGHGAGDTSGPHEAPALRLDSARARERLSWRPVWDLDAALAATAGWHLTHAEGADLRSVSLEQLARFEASAAQPYSAASSRATAAGA